MSQILVTGEAKVRDIQGPVVANSGVITALDGDASQYVRGDGTLADFPTSTGGGSSVSYYLNSSVSQGTIGGVAYRQLGKTPISGAGTDIAISTTGYIASYITDANDPALLEVPAGNFNCEFYFSVNNNTGNPFTYAEVYKYDGTTFTLIGTSVGVPEYITEGTVINPYYFAVPVSSSVLSITDRIAIRIYVNVDGRTVTLHTENNHLCQVVTTFSKGLTSLNNLTRQVQFLATGTSGTDFAISSSTATHTFNLPVASAANTGKLSSTDWSTFNGKQPAGNYVTLDTTQTITAAKTFSLDILVNSLTIGKGAGSIASNTAIGSSALAANTTGTLNTAIGNFSLLSNTTGYGNTSVGHSALGYNTTGFFNAAIGVNALLSNSTGTYNNALGTAALYNNTTGSNNTAVGQVAGTNNTTGSNNTYIGFGSGGGITTGSNNTIIGQFTGTAAMANNIVLADGAGNVRYRYDGTNNNLYGNVNFSSTIGNGTFTYTLPSATGTIALTSNLSSYVPYTGATTNVDLGTNSISLFNITSNNVLIVKNTGSVTGTNGFSSFSGNLANNGFTFAPNNSSYHRFIVPTSSNYDYTFPATTGTLALTSALSAYLPLAGGTLTGVLNGTSATFSGNMAIGSSTTALSPLQVVATGTIVRLGEQSGTTGKQFLIGIDGTSGRSELQSVWQGTSYTSLALQPSGGNVLIGTTGDNGAKLQVSGSVTNTGYFITPAAATTGGLSGFVSQYNAGSASSRSWKITNDIVAYGDFAIQQSTTQTGSTYDSKLYINASGNVGIGTSSPSSPLDVVADNSTAINLRLRGRAADSVGQMEFWNNAQSTRYGYIATDSTSMGMITTQAIPLVLGTNSTERMRITSGGNVGIGTTALTPIGSSSNRVFAIGASSGAAAQILLQESGTNYGVVSAYGGDMFVSSTSTIPLIFGTNTTERIRITSGGNVQIGGTTGSDSRLYIKGVSATSSNNALLIHNGSGSDLFFIRNDGVVYTGTAALSPYNLTTANSANLFVASDGGLLRSTSSLKYKKNVKNYTKGLAEVMQLRAVTYQGKNDRDNDKQFAGLIAEEVHELGLTEFVQYAEDGSPDALAYQNMIALAFKAIQELKAEIDELKNK